MPKGDREKLKADCEDGFTRVSNLILEALSLARLNGTQMAICLFIFRRTYGWNRSQDAISLAEFAAACGSSKAYISRQLQDLIKKNIIHRVTYQPGKTPVYTFVTRVTEWDQACIDLEALRANVAGGIYDCSESGQGLHDCTTPNVQGLHNPAIQGLYNCTTPGLPDCIRVNEPSNHDPPDLESPLKTERKTVKERKSFSPDSLPYQLAESLLNKILEHLPGYKQPDLEKWAEQMEAMLRLDKRPPDEVEAVITFAQEDTFWRTNILSVTKLRKQYDQLNARRIQQLARSPSQKKLNNNNGGEENDDYERFFQ